MEKVHGVLIMTLLGMLQFLELIMAHHLILIHCFLVLREGYTFDIDGSFGAPEKKFSINFSKAKTKFCLSLHYNGDNICLFVNGEKIYISLKELIKISNFHLNFI